MKTDPRKSMVAWCRIKALVFVCIDRSKMMTRLTRPLPRIPKTPDAVLMTSKDVDDPMSKT